ncbi:hypothetical protein [Sporomusa sp.]|uniref:hypothetical protein n=1 Tax=Sporomusa sp. TaxID=2078658 RepID=UPI002C61E441|nr:hypothetical protein [Sporomusa sp.]HWR43662.1 hypothetical protein [Sporomusa sp.]
MNLRISDVIKDSTCITVNLDNTDQDDYQHIDITAIFLLAIESNVQLVVCSGESTLQAKAIAKLAASLQASGINVIIDSNYGYDQLLAKSRRSKYIKAMLTNTNLLRPG